ncbi:MAG: hydrolase, partial [Glutamicibacter protophormiae]
VDTLDWKHHDPVKTVKIALDEVKPGSIILMHDIHESSVEAVPDLVAQLTARGYTLVTVDQLFAGSDFVPGAAYERGAHPAAAGD